MKEQGIRIRNVYYRDVLPIRIIILAVLAVITFIAFKTGNVLFETICGMLLGAVGLFVLCAVITALITGAVIAGGKYEMVEGYIRKYQFFTTRRLTYLYADIDGQYFCNTWANRMYSRGTRVYLVSIGNGSLGDQKIMVKADSVDG